MGEVGGDRPERRLVCFSVHTVSALKACCRSQRPARRRVPAFFVKSPNRDRSPCDVAPSTPELLAGLHDVRSMLASLCVLVALPIIDQRWRNPIPAFTFTLFQV